MLQVEDDRIIEKLENQRLDTCEEILILLKRSFHTNKRMVEKIVKSEIKYPFSKKEEEILAKIQLKCLTMKLDKELVTEILKKTFSKQQEIRENYIEEHGA